MAQLVLDTDLNIDWDNIPVKDAYVMGFQTGDLVQTVRPLRPRSGDGRTIPLASVGSVKAITVNTALVHFLYCGDHLIKLDDLEYATDYKPAPTRLAHKREDGPNR